MQFVDVQITMDSSSASRAYMTVEVKGRDARTGEPTRRRARSQRHDGEAERRLGDYDRGVAGDPGDCAASLMPS